MPLLLVSERDKSSIECKRPGQIKVLEKVYKLLKAVGGEMNDDDIVECLNDRLRIEVVDHELFSGVAAEPDIDENVTLTITRTRAH